MFEDLVPGPRRPGTMLPLDAQAAFTIAELVVLRYRDKQLESTQVYEREMLSMLARAISEVAERWKESSSMTEVVKTVSRSPEAAALQESMKRD